MIGKINLQKVRNVKFQTQWSTSRISSLLPTPPHRDIFMFIKFAALNHNKLFSWQTLYWLTQWKGSFHPLVYLLPFCNIKYFFISFLLTLCQRVSYSSVSCRYFSSPHFMIQIGCSMFIEKAFSLPPSPKKNNSRDILPVTKFDLWVMDFIDFSSYDFPFFIRPKTIGNFSLFWSPWYRLNNKDTAWEDCFMSGVSVNK
jgi:hypothetical protein